jgi:tetratricopeptide (TPR) repeat protein
MADKTSLIKEAQKYLAKGQLDKAIATWEKIVLEYPDGSNYNFIGDLYLKKGDRKSSVESFLKAAHFFREEGFSLKALALFKKVLNISPANAAALYALGELSEEKELVTDAIKYYLATADSLAKEGKKDELFDIYSRILSLSPSNIPLRIKVAEILFKQGLISDAAKEYLAIAGIYESKGDFQKSEEYCRKAIDMQPLNKDAVIGLSYLYEKAGKRDKAAEVMKEATVLFHENIEVLSRAAEVSLAVNDTLNAKNFLTKINELDPDNAKSRGLLGEIYLEEGSPEMAWAEYRFIIDWMIREKRYDEAVGLFERFRDIDPLETGMGLVSLHKQLGNEPKIIEELVSLGDIYQGKGMLDDALSCFGEALEREPGNDFVRKRIADLKGEPLEDITDAASVIESAEGAEPAGTDKSGHISVKAEKTLDEIFTEADIFIRYGLLNEAQELMEGLRLKVPENMDLHLRLKNIYAELDDKESAVTECIILSELYKRNGDRENAEKILREGYEISPEDPRLAEKGLTCLLEPTSLASGSTAEFPGASSGEPDLVEDHDEELAEADFYARQGLIQEALKILLKLQTRFPDNRDIAERLFSLEGGAGISYAQELPEAMGQEQSYEASQEDKAPIETVPGGEARGKEEPEEKPEPEPEQKDYEGFLSEQEIVEAQEMAEPALDDDVMEIFQEFKKGLEDQLEDEDSETHYNLGIAYKEMGLVDDAIKEFQTARNDKKRFLQSSSMLGVCYMEKGLYSLAIDVLSKILESRTEQDESHWSIKYDLAEAYEKNNNLREALDLYTEVYGWNAKFRNASEKIGVLKTQMAKNSAKDKPKEKKDRVSYL